MQQNEALKKKQAEAFETIENWNMRQYYFNMLQYALKKQLVLPFIEFTVNGQLLFRLEAEEEEDEEEEEEEEEEEGKTVYLEFIVKYFGSQHSFVKDKASTTYCTLTAEDAKKIGPCNIPGFQLLFEDEATPSKLCFCSSFGRVSQASLEKALDAVLESFKTLQSMEANHEFDQLSDSCVEKLFSIASHDKAAVAYEIFEKTTSDEEVQYKNEKLEAEWKQAEQRSLENAKQINQNAVVSSCQLHADIWQRNEKLRMTAIGRQYEDLAVLSKLGDAMHVRFRGADEDLQKKICIGELLINLLTTLVVNC